MELETLKLELIEWLSKKKDSETIELIKNLKDSFDADEWWDDLSDDNKKGIKNGLKDIEEGRVTNKDVIRKYGL